MHMKIRVVAFLKNMPLRSREDHVRYKRSNVITGYYVYIFSADVNNSPTMLTVLFKRSQLRTKAISKIIIHNWQTLLIELQIPLRPNRV